MEPQQIKQIIIEPAPHGQGVQIRVEVNHAQPPDVASITNLLRQAILKLEKQ